jgi:alpha-methylacyl-CoA racemase
VLGLDPDMAEVQYDRTTWPELRETLATIFRQKTRAEWCDVMEGKEVCFAPVLSMAEAPSHPHNAAHRTFVSQDGIVQPAAAPRFSRTPGQIAGGPGPIGQHARQALENWGLSEQDVESVLGEDPGRRGEKLKNGI